MQQLGAFYKLTTSENARTACWLYTNRMVDLSPSPGSAVTLCPITLVFKKSYIEFEGSCIFKVHVHFSENLKVRISYLHSIWLLVHPQFIIMSTMNQSIIRSLVRSIQMMPRRVAIMKTPWRWCQRLIPHR